VGKKPKDERRSSFNEEKTVSQEEKKRRETMSGNLETKGEFFGATVKKGTSGRA